jgi:hypothetical protein
MDSEDFVFSSDYPDAEKTLYDISYDSAHDLHMTKSNILAYDFDKIKGDYTRKLHKSEDGVDSVDAIWFQAEKCKVVFIEFKNGESFSPRALKDKMRDSLLINCDITNRQITDTRRNAEFIVVYNKDAKPIKKEENVFEIVQDSKSRDKIKSYFLKKADAEFIRWGLEKYIGVYFESVHTFNQEEFEVYLKECL